MACLTEAIKEMAKNADLWMLSTVSDDGSPRTIPVHFKKVLSDDEIIIVNNYMTETLNNLEARPDKVSLMLWATGVVCHLKGEVRIESTGAIYQQGVELVKAKRPNLTPKAVVVFKISSAQTWHRPG